MTDKIKFTQDFWQEWKQDPKATAEKYGISWAEVDKDWHNKDWRSVSWDDFDKLWRKSRWAAWIDWS